MTFFSYITSESNIIKTFSLPESNSKIAHGIDIQIRGSHLRYECW